jgi:hypothetical protein
MFTYFITFKPKGEKKYRLYTNQIFTQVKEADEFATKSLGKKGDFKIEEYNSETFNKYWKYL